MSKEDAQECNHDWENVGSKRQTAFKCKACGIYTFEPPAQTCDMGAMCLNCQPRGPNGECPDKQPAQHLGEKK